MLTEKEEDQYAALAADIEIDHYRGDVAMIKRVNSRGQEEVVAWRPKVDDGDALRLVNRLRLCVQIGRLDGTVVVTCTQDSRIYEAVVYLPGEEPDQATRTAVYNAAIWLGRFICDA